MKRSTPWSALMAVLVLGAVSTPAAAQSLREDFKLDHFKCYRVADFGTVADHTVRLDDQFDVAAGNAEFANHFRPLRLCNPVEKRVGREVDRIKFNNHHLTMYSYDPDPIVPLSGIVLVENQFGQQKMAFESAFILAVPTAKTVPPEDPVTFPPPDLDHYKCYYVDGDVSKRFRVVGLADQFERVRHKLLDPVLFCNPVRKSVGSSDAGGAFEIINREDHLTCYRISIATSEWRNVVVANQFVNGIDESFVVGPADLLCVPTRKKSFTFHKPFGLTARTP